MLSSVIFSGGIYLTLIHTANAAPADECSADPPSNYNLGLHIAAVFIIMLASGLGAFIPVISKVQPAFRISGKIITLGKYQSSWYELKPLMLNRYSLRQIRRQWYYLGHWIHPYATISHGKLDFSMST